MAGQKGASGGARFGSGRKPKGTVEVALTGHRGKVLSGPGSGEAPIVAAIDPFDPPVDLPAENRLVWQQLAPHAFQARTLTRATERAFLLLCRNVVLEELLAKIGAGGPNHRGIIARVEAGYSAFMLRPFGKPIFEAEPQAPANPLDEFLHRSRA
jgi:hypothetical protein